jgi:hypothetical protein
MNSVTKSIGMAVSVLALLAGLAGQANATLVYEFTATSDSAVRGVLFTNIADTATGPVTITAANIVEIDINPPMDALQRFPVGPGNPPFVSVTSNFTTSADLHTIVSGEFQVFFFDTHITGHADRLRYIADFAPSVFDVAGSWSLTPEPATLVSASIGGLFGLAYAWRRKRKARIADA